MKKLLLLFFVLAQASTQLQAQQQFIWNDKAQQIYESATSLRIPEARKLIAIEKKNNPNNLINYLLESYADFYQLFLTENPADYKKIYPEFERRIKLLESGPKQSPFYLYSIALVHLHKSVIAIRFDKNWEAALDFRKAYLLFKDNKKAFPSFSPNDVYYGFLTTVIGTIPKGYQWMANILGMSGKIKEGNALVLKYINTKDEYAKYCRNEALFFYPYLLMNFEGNEKKAFDYLNATPYDFKRNHLHAYMATNLYLNHQQSDKALDIAKNIEQSDAYLSLPFWQLEKGYIYINQLKFDNAQKSLTDFITTFKGQFYVKDAYEKLSWIYYLQGDTKKAAFYRNEVLQKGNQVTDADKLANQNAESDIWPNPILLKARLLSDGGYQNQAIQVIAGKNSKDFNTDADRTEFAYRLGRIYDLMGQSDQAIPFYKSAIEKGQALKEYFASRAALQLGIIFEKKGDFAKAIYFFNTCIDMKNHAFKNSIDQKAKSGIQRCSKQ
mgnify:CR=1 FL=1